MTKKHEMRSGHANRNSHDDSFNERAKAFFRKRAGMELRVEDLREIVRNVTAYFDLLNELYEKYKGDLKDGE